MIIDAVNPRRTFFALEAMPWSFPDSTDTYLQLFKAVPLENQSTSHYERFKN